MTAGRYVAPPPATHPAGCRTPTAAARGVRGSRSSAPSARSCAARTAAFATRRSARRSPRFPGWLLLIPRVAATKDLLEMAIATLSVVSQVLTLLLLTNYSPRKHWWRWPALNQLLTNYLPRKQSLTTLVGFNTVRSLLTNYSPLIVISHCWWLTWTSFQPWQTIN